MICHTRPMTRPFHVRATAWVWALVPALIVCLPAGCYSSRPMPTRTDAPVTSPTMTIQPSGDRWEIIVAAPTPGWQIRRDFLLDALGYREQFLTLRTPNPQFMTPQVVVEQRILTEARTDQPLQVLVRIEPFTEPDPDRPYGPAARSPAPPVPTAP